MRSPITRAQPSNITILPERLRSYTSCSKTAM
ncbi:Uncharacterised protein [Segatella copri]|nr:Uncharacterised protein [Segatella copri]